MATKKEISRREFLSGSTLLVAGSLLAACQPTLTPVPPTAVPPTAVPVATAVPPTKPPATAVPPTAVPPTAVPTVVPCPKGEICIRSTTVKLPTDKVTFRWLDPGDSKGIFWNKFFPKYTAAHPNITFQYDGLPWNEIAKIVPIGIQNNNLHDVFSLPPGVTSAQAYSEGWLQPYDGLIPDLKEIKAKYPAGSFIEGINVFGGKTYCLSHGTNKRSSSLLLYNSEYLAQAGIDPASKPMTWDEFRAAAKKLTQQGAGKYYGVIEGGNQVGRLGIIVRDLARIAGASTLNDIDHRTGEYAYVRPEYIAAMELWLAIQSDGSMFPGYLSINAPQARAQIATGAAGMMLQGMWCTPVWQKDNPTFKYGAAMTPVVDRNKMFPLHIDIATSNEYWIYSKSKHPEIAADIFYQIASLEGQRAWNAVGGAGDPGYMPESYDTLSSNPVDIFGMNLQTDLHKVGPSPLVRNPDAAMVSLEMKPLTPSFEQVIQGLLAGQLTDIKKQFQDVADRANKNLDRAIKAAQDKGAKVSRADWVFKNWDPLKDYTEEDYKKA